VGRRFVEFTETKRSARPAVTVRMERSETSTLRMSTT
jgi:hypothetical protein